MDGPLFDSDQAVIRQHINDERQRWLSIDAHSEIESAVVPSEQRQRHGNVTSILDKADRSGADYSRTGARRLRHIGALSTGRKDTDSVLDAC